VAVEAVLGVHPKALVDAMHRAPILQHTSTKAVEELASSGTIRQYRKGTYVFHQGDPAPDVFFLFEGKIQISSLSFTGHRQLHTTLEPAQFFGELGVLGEMRRTATAEALEDSLTWVVSGEGFLSFLALHPESSRALLAALARQIQAHEAFTEDLLFLDLKGRVAKRLLQLVSPSLDKLPKDGTMLPAVVTHADLASLCGGSRENVTRILSEFQRRGLVDKREHRYVLKNVTGLRRMASL
jgi:CRP-like cAMP-binding protein